VTVDELLKDEIEINNNGMGHPEQSNMLLPLIERIPTSQEIERLRLILSTFQDGTGQLIQKNGPTLPGWRDFERSVALAFNGTAQESKSIFDVLISNPSGGKYGISCKMRGTLNDISRTGRVTIELSNSAGKFWQALNNLKITQDNYKQYPEQVGKTLVELIGSWHQLVSISNRGSIDLSKSYYLVLSWNRVGEYQLHQFSLELPSNIVWTFPLGEARLVGTDTTGKLFEWYGESGGQLKYYPLSDMAIWISEKFRLEPLPSSDNPYGLLAKASSYFPDLWARVNPSEPK